MKQGVFYGVLAYFVWGLLPLYWKLLQSLSPWEILAHRIVWSCVFVVAVLFVFRRWKQLLTSVTSMKKKAALVLSSLLITANWLIYIWAVNDNHVIETSLGYYINPLISVLFGVIFLKERLVAGQWLALVLAAIGVSVTAFQFGHIPWVAILLALTFGLYGLAKKIVNIESMLGLAWETMIAFPFSFLYLVWIHVDGTDGAFSLSIPMTLVLVLTGVVTAIPLYWFGLAAQKLPLSTIGFIQYLSPTTSLMLALLVFKESFTTVHAVSFGFIWTALVVYTVATMKERRHSRTISVDS